MHGTRDFYIIKQEVNLHGNDLAKPNKSIGTYKFTCIYSILAFKQPVVYLK